MNFIGTAHRLTFEDYERAAEFLRCDLFAIRAVLRVEARGSGFDFRLRPVILYEPHIFYRLLGSGPLRNQAVANGVAYLRWGFKPYPKTSDARYQQLERAILIDQSKALQSTSWGIGQVMGFNYARCGYVSAEHLVAGAKESEGEQLMAMCRYIKSARLDDELREHRWAEFARGYNGPGYAANLYDYKLAQAYKQFQREGAVNA